MLRRVYVVADVGALHPEDYVFGDVGGVVGDALQVAGHEQSVECLPHDFGTLIHGLDQLDEGIVFHAVDHVIHFEDSLREFDLALDEGFESAANHGADGCAHAGDIDGQVNGGKVHHVHDA